MFDSENQHSPEKPHRSVLVNRFSFRDIRFTQLAIILISDASVVFGLVVESFSSP